MRHLRERARRRTVQLTVAVVAIAVTVAFVIVARGEDDSAGPERSVTLNAVLAQPEEHLGDEVTVSGEVEDLVVDPGAFTIGDRVSPREDDLVVVARRSTGLQRGSVGEESVVRVQGVVRRLERPADDEDLLFEDEEDDALDEFEGEPAIVATGIEILQR